MKNTYLYQIYHPIIYPQSFEEASGFRPTKSSSDFGKSSPSLPKSDNTSNAFLESSVASSSRTLEEGITEETSAESKPSRKRFVWPEALHKDFVAAVFDVGLKNATPKAILELLPHDSSLTTEHVKSHLQKFRVHRDRSRAEFLSHYEMSVRTGRIPIPIDIFADPSQTLLLSKPAPSQPASDHNDSALKSIEYCSESEAKTNESNECEETNENKNIRVNSLKRSYGLVNSTLHVQSLFFEMMKVSLEEQDKARAKIAKAIVELDPTALTDILEMERRNSAAVLSTPNRRTFTQITSEPLAVKSSLSQTLHPHLNHSSASYYSHSTDSQGAVASSLYSNADPTAASSSMSIVASSNALLMVSEMQNLRSMHNALQRRKEMQMAPFMKPPTAPMRKPPRTVPPQNLHQGGRDFSFYPLVSGNGGPSNFMSNAVSVSVSVAPVSVTDGLTGMVSATGGDRGATLPMNLETLMKEWECERTEGAGGMNSY